MAGKRLTCTRVPLASLRLCVKGFACFLRALPAATTPHLGLTLRSPLLGFFHPQEETEAAQDWPLGTQLTRVPLKLQVQCGGRQGGGGGGGLTLPT